MAGDDNFFVPPALNETRGHSQDDLPELAPLYETKFSAQAEPSVVTGENRENYHLARPQRKRN